MLLYEDRTKAQHVTSPKKNGCTMVLTVVITAMCHNNDRKSHYIKVARLPLPVLSAQTIPVKC